MSHDHAISARRASSSSPSSLPRSHSGAICASDLSGARRHPTSCGVRKPVIVRLSWRRCPRRSHRWHPDRVLTGRPRRRGAVPAFSFRRKARLGGQKARVGSNLARPGQADARPGRSRRHRRRLKAAYAGTGDAGGCGGTGTRSLARTHWALAAAQPASRRRPAPPGGAEAEAAKPRRRRRRRGPVPGGGFAAADEARAGRKTRWRLSSGAPTPRISPIACNRWPTMSPPTSRRRRCQPSRRRRRIWPGRARLTATRRRQSPMPRRLPVAAASAQAAQVQAETGPGRARSRPGHPAGGRGLVDQVGWPEGPPRPDGPIRRPAGEARRDCPPKQVAEADTAAAAAARSPESRLRGPTIHRRPAIPPPTSGGFLVRRPAGISSS